MSIRSLVFTSNKLAKALSSRHGVYLLQSSPFATRRPPVKRSSSRAPPAPKAVVPVEQAWEEVVDKPSGQIYYWNTVTNETTALGAPRPTGPTALGPSNESQPPQQGGGVMAGLGQVMAQGFAFGVGSSVAHGIVGSMFGGGHDSGSSGGGGDDAGDGFDI